jgi:uncharacterized repeat protein (TIGR03803 family)
MSAAASAQTLITLTSFDGVNGAQPGYGSLIADANGDLFGTTYQGGAASAGTVFEIVNTGGVYAGTPTTLVSFDGGNDGWGPANGLIADANGDLFGTTEYGGTSGGNGTVFEIVNSGGVYAGIPTTLVSFNGNDGVSVISSLIADANGNLFGTAEYGGTSMVPGSGGDGTVFEILKTSSGYASTPTTLVNFNGNDGMTPFAGLIADANGNLFGTTAGDAGMTSYGTVFEIAKTSTGYASTPTILVSFNGNDGSHAFAGLIADANGNLFGTTANGGASGLGTVFEIVKTSSGYASTPTTLVSFNGYDGALPDGGLIADANGSLFGTTAAGGASSFGLASGFGTVFEIVNTSSGYASTPTTLVSFNGGSDGLEPIAGLIADASGNLFGTTYRGGASSAGTVFEVTGSGFVPPRQFAGMPGSANCTGTSISTLAHTYGGIAHAASALGYASVTALESAVANYCGN